MMTLKKKRLEEFSSSIMEETKTGLSKRVSLRDQFVVQLRSKGCLGIINIESFSQADNIFESMSSAERLEQSIFIARCFEAQAPFYFIDSFEFQASISSSFNVLESLSAPRNC